MTPETYGPWVTASVLGALAGFERWRNVKAAKHRDANAEAVTDARKHQERAEVMSRLAEDYKALFEREHGELKKYRDEVHEKAKKDQDLSSKKDERIMELQGRPDFSDLFDHLKTQSDLSVKILGGIENVMRGIQGVVTMMEQLLERENSMHENRKTT